MKKVEIKGTSEEEQIRKALDIDPNKIETSFQIQGAFKGAKAIKDFLALNVVNEEPKQEKLPKAEVIQTYNQKLYAVWKKQLDERLDDKHLDFLLGRVA